MLLQHYSNNQILLSALIYSLPFILLTVVLLLLLLLLVDGTSSCAENTAASYMSEITSDVLLPHIHTLDDTAVIAATAAAAEVDDDDDDDDVTSNECALRMGLSPPLPLSKSISNLPTTAAAAAAAAVLVLSDASGDSAYSSW
jgi:hypothetical protein